MAFYLTSVTSGAEPLACPFSNSDYRIPRPVASATMVVPFRLSNIRTAPPIPSPRSGFLFLAERSGAVRRRRPAAPLAVGPRTLSTGQRTVDQAAHLSLILRRRGEDHAK